MIDEARAKDLVELEAQRDDALELVRTAMLGAMSDDQDFVTEAEDLLAECGQRP